MKSAMLAAMDKKQQSAIPGERDSGSHEGRSLGIFWILANRDPINQRLSSIDSFRNLRQKILLLGNINQDTQKMAPVIATISDIENFRSIT